MNVLIDQTTLLIKTFERPSALNRLVTSIRKYYTDIKIVVVDDGRAPLSLSGVTYIRTEFDVGISAGRNLGLAQITTPYFVLLDDDYIFSRDTVLEKLLLPVAEDRYDIVCGVWEDCFQRNRCIVCYLEYDPPNEVRIVGKPVAKQDPEYIPCDIGQNFFAARTRTVLDLNGWDERLKVKEHWDFFLRAKLHTLRCAVAPSVRIIHAKTTNPFYIKYRRREEIYHAILNKKWDITSSRWMPHDR